MRGRSWNEEKGEPLLDYDHDIISLALTESQNCEFFILIFWPCSSYPAVYAIELN